MTVVALPGFLGVPTDWKPIFPACVVPDIPILPLWEAAKWLNRWAEAIPGPRLLAGYSLGGRLALHAAILKPELWSGCLIVSAHTGLTDETTKAARLEEDQLWARRFVEDPWDQLMGAWNQRGALASSPPLTRIEKEYSRTQLAERLDRWSLGRQECLKAAVEELNIPFRWLAGELDFSFCQIARSLKFTHQNSHIEIVASCGHRILNEQPNIITKESVWTL